MRYRREIDGLRAVAVLPVILFHAGFSVFSGGYVGVDVFFVISGYLITSILIGELEQGSFSILRFYERRARRILPALFVVMLACLPFAYMWMLPSQLMDFAQSLIAVILFCSNILFWQESGYFGAAAELKPLLHTWSLAVEEQFYLIVPVFLLLAWRFGRNKVFWSIVAIAAFSFFLTEWGARRFPIANFYLAPTRAWELLAGSICSFLTFGQKQRSSSLLSATGLALIVFAIFYYDESTPFPSVFALGPVAGTALIILFADKNTWTARLLSTRVFVGIGLISYSAYLWHQPVFAFARLRSLTEPSHIVMSLLVIVSLILAYSTWYWVEQPVRKLGNFKIVTQRSVFAASGAAFLAIGLAGHLGSGFEWRWGPEITRFVAAEKDTLDLSCLFDNGGNKLEHPVSHCASTSGIGIDVLIIGDSHSNALRGGVGQALDRAGVGYYSVSHQSCLPLLGFRRFTAEGASSCQDFLSGTFEWAKEQGIGTVVLASRFQIFLDGSRFDNTEGGVEKGGLVWVDLLERSESKWDDHERRVRVIERIETSIRDLANHFNVVLVYPIPEAGWNVPSYGLKKILFDDGNATITTSYAAYIERTSYVNSLFDRLTLEIPNVFGAQVQKSLCNHETMRCLNADEYGIYYHDDDHMSNAGARLVAPIIVKEIQKSLRAIKGSNRG